MFSPTTPFQDDKILWDLALSRYHLPAVTVADQIGIFSLIQRGLTTVKQLAEELAQDIKGIEALTCLLSSLNLLDKSYDKLVLNSITQNYLLPSSPLYWGPALNSKFSRIHESVEYERLLVNFSNGKAPLLSNGKNLLSMWEKGDLGGDETAEFTKIMHVTIFSAAIEAIQKNVFKGIKHLLDVGGGSGCFVSAFVKKYKAKGTVFDLPAVCEAAKQYLNELETSDLITLQPGNFFSDAFPQGADGILFSNIFHDWSLEKAYFLIKKAYDILPSGGKIFVHEMFLNEEKNGPLATATFNLLMYINFKSQQYTAKELFTLLQEAGFKNQKIVKTHSYYSVIEAEKL